MTVLYILVYVLVHVRIPMYRIFFSVPFSTNTSLFSNYSSKFIRNFFKLDGRAEKQFHPKWPITRWAEQAHVGVYYKIVRGATFAYTSYTKTVAFVSSFRMCGKVK